MKLWSSDKGDKKSRREQPEREDEDAADDEMRSNDIGANGGKGGGECRNERKPDQKNHREMLRQRSGDKLRESFEMQRVRDSRDCQEQTERDIKQQEESGEVALRFLLGQVRAGKRLALGGKNFRPREREWNGCSNKQDHHQESRQARIQMTKRREQIGHG